MTAPGLPLDFGPIRRTRLLAEDAISTTWDGWEGWRGVRVRLRVLAAGAGASPADRAMLRAAAASGTGSPVVWIDDDAWPRLVSAPIRRTLADLLPWDDFADPVPAVWLLGGVARSLATLHAAGETHGTVDPHHVVLDDAGWRLLWLGRTPGAPRADPQGDLRALGHLARAVTHPDDPVGSLLTGFIDYPPPSAGDAARLICHALGASLAAERHDLVRRHRRTDLRTRIAGLRGLASRLARVPPPVARGCLSAAPDQSPYMIASDGTTVYAGPVSGTSLTGLAAVAGPEDFDVPAVRAALRAGRTPDPTGTAAAATIALGGTPRGVAQLCTWLAAALTLRTERRLLNAHR